MTYEGITLIRKRAKVGRKKEIRYFIFEDGDGVKKKDIPSLVARYKNYLAKIDDTITALIDNFNQSHPL